MFISWETRGFSKRAHLLPFMLPKFYLLQKAFPNYEGWSKNLLLPPKFLLFLFSSLVFSSEGGENMMKMPLGYISTYYVYMLIYKGVFIHMSIFFLSKITAFKKSRDSHLCNENHGIEIKKVFKIKFLILWVKSLRKIFGDAK